MTDQTILLVEDNRDDELLMLRALKKTNLARDVIVARDGEQALDYLLARGAYSGRDSADTPRLMLLDLKLPRINGLEVLAQVRNHPETRYLPVVMLTSSDEERDVIASYNRGANSYIRKPVDFEQFNDMVHQLAWYWLGLNITPGHEH